MNFSSGRSESGMFALYCARKPTLQMKKAYRLEKTTHDYLFESTDPVVQYLEHAGELIRTTREVLDVTHGNGTSSCMHFEVLRMTYEVYDRTFRWLQQHREFTKAALEAKYPGMVERMRREDEETRKGQRCCNATWVDYQEGEVPNLVSEFLHRGRLGEVIDEVLHLK